MKRSDGKSNSGETAAVDDKQARLASALRANLRKRKQQDRNRRSDQMPANEPIPTDKDERGS